MRGIIFPELLVRSDFGTVECSILDRASLQERALCVVSKLLGPAGSTDAGEVRRRCYDNQPYDA